MTARRVAVLLVWHLLTHEAAAEDGVIGVEVARGADSKPTVAIWSTEKIGIQRGITVDAAAELLRHAGNMNYTLEVGIVVRDHLRPTEYGPILKAVSENMSMDLVFLDGSGPAFFKDHFRKRIESLFSPSPSPQPNASNHALQPTVSYAAVLVPGVCYPLFPFALRGLAAAELVSR